MRLLIVTTPFETSSLIRYRTLFHLLSDLMFGKELQHPTNEISGIESEEGEGKDEPYLEYYL